MDGSLKSKVDEFIETFNIIKKEYYWSIDDLTMRFIALVYTLGNKTFDADQFSEMAKYIKKNSKWGSYYRGHQMYSTASLLITKFEDPEQAFLNLLEYEEILEAEGFKNSPYLSIAAYTLLLTCDSEHVFSRVKKSMELYKEMKNNHFWLTGSDDYPIAVLLSESDKTNDILISEMENNYDLLNREGFGKSNGLQFLSHLLTFAPGAGQDKAQKTKWIYDRLKKEKLNVSSTYYGLLGYLSILGEFSEQAVEEVISVTGYLKEDKNFRWVDKGMNVLSATALVTNQYIARLSRNSELLKTGIGISIETLIAAQTAALIATISAATAASSAAASSGGN